MNIYRSYFEKNNTIVKNSELNSAKNQVTEIAYGGKEKTFSKFLFKLDLSGLKNKIETREITQDKINSHILYLKNTINLVKNYNIFYNNQKRATDFNLILFKINEDWAEGNGHDILLNNIQSISERDKNTSASNWVYKKTNEEWSTNGIVDINNIEIIDTIHFDNGDEDFVADITTYVNDILYTSGSVDYGLGISFPLDFENLIDDYIKSINFHTKYTNTFFEPYLETLFDNIIQDDRSCFHLDVDNRLYFYAKRNTTFYNINILNVNIYDDNDELLFTYDSNMINKHSKGVYYIDINLSSETNTDSIIYRDDWIFEDHNGDIKTISNTFYIMSDILRQEIQNNLTKVKIFGIYNNKIIKRGEILNVDFNFNSIFNSFVNYCDYRFVYDLHVKYGDNPVYIIKDHNVNKVPNKYFISFDTEIFVPNTYYLTVNLYYLDNIVNSKTINFKIVD